MWIFLTRIEEDGRKKKDTEKLYGRCLLVAMMNKLFGLAPEYGDIRVDASGKPYFSCDFLARLREYTGDEKKTCCFNISHSGVYVVCAISDDNVGCDIQKVKKIPRNLHSFLALVNDKKEEVEKMTMEEQIRLWTRYESLSKYIGCGIPINEEILLQNMKTCKFSSHFIEDYVLTICGKEINADYTIERVNIPRESVAQCMEWIHV